MLSDDDDVDDDDDDDGFHGIGRAIDLRCGRLLVRVGSYIIS